jgi:putative sporulation protein YtaF
VLIGVWVLYQYFRQKRIPPPENEGAQVSRETGDGAGLEPVPVLKMHFGRLVIQILKEPHTADMDMSGTISGLEACLLGVSLAVDSLGAGVAVAMLGFEIAVTALFVGVGHLLAIYCRAVRGKMHAPQFYRQAAGFDAGCNPDFFRDNEKLN